VDADGKSLVMITGANQGGKSTLLRSLGLAHLMMRCGMFVGARMFRASVCAGVVRYYKREEDVTRERGKLDEELGRMSEIADQITADSILLCNESFASTNEREGSEIAGQVVRAMLDKRIKVIFVTDIYDLAHSFHAQQLNSALFLRAEREPDGRRSSSSSASRCRPGTAKTPTGTSSEPLRRHRRPSRTRDGDARSGPTEPTTACHHVYAARTAAGLRGYGRASWTNGAAANRARTPSCSSMSSTWLYSTTSSEIAGAPI
jgi:hypothetical protein